jgi:hypothetical protein
VAGDHVKVATTIEKGTLPQMDNVAGTARKGSVTIRGRTFSAEELRLMQDIAARSQQLSRTEISRKVCTALGWRQPNGWLKDRACRDVLITLERQGFLRLPPRRATPWHMRTTPGRVRPTNGLRLAPDAAVVSAEAGRLSLEFAKGNEAEAEWNALVSAYHYLGHRVIVGRCIKYIVRCDSWVVGALSFSSPVWRVKARDAVLHGIGMPTTAFQDAVINNSRFVLLPHLRVRNLASRVLSVACGQIVRDWERYYSVSPAVAETFVDCSLFRGTSYMAANWVKVGVTKGYSKRGMVHHNGQMQKAVYLYGLTRNVRRRLKQTVAEMKRVDTPGVL